MSDALAFAYARGWNLARTLMLFVTVFRTDDGEFGVMPSAEYDGDLDLVVHEFDPFR